MYTNRFIAAYRARVAYAKAADDYHGRLRDDWRRFGKPAGRELAPGAARVFDMYWRWFIEDIHDISKGMLNA